MIKNIEIMSLEQTRATIYVNKSRTKIASLLSHKQFTPQKIGMNRSEKKKVLVYLRGGVHFGQVRILDWPPKERLDVGGLAEAQLLFKVHFFAVFHLHENSDDTRVCGLAQQGGEHCLGNVIGVGEDRAYQSSSKKVRRQKSVATHARWTPTSDGRLSVLFLRQ